MNTNKFTPGPWHIYASDEYLAGKTPINLVSVWAGEMPREHVVCNSCDSNDARLIASAPDLLYALEELLYGAIPHKRDFLITAYAKNLAQSAIAKARGE